MACHHTASLPYNEPRIASWGAAVDLMRRLRLAFHSPLWPSRSREAVDARNGAVKQVVIRVARGNIRLQRGEFDTAADIEAQYERIKGFEFED